MIIKNEKKIKKTVKVLAITLSLSLVLGACGHKNNDTDNKNVVKTEEKDSSSNTDDKIIELTSKENDIIANNKNLWNKVFEKADKNDTEKSKEMPYDEYLKSLVEKSKDKLSEEDMKKIDNDLAQIKDIESKLSKLKKDTEKSQSSNEESDDLQKFPAFNAKTLNGEDISNDIFKDKKVTLVNFWFNGCSPCVRELPELQKLNDEIDKKGGQVIGINTEAIDGNNTAIKEAKDILDKQGIKYKNISLDPSSDLGEYAGKIMSYPTSILVDKDGNIVGEPIVGGIDNEKIMESVKDGIDKILSKSK
ncbi:TlpA disulfide reductase family protein [Anaerococcus porci]|uniref:TlpA family protein disulfide reductase n=1 Tax=Anaerococcus porci TaxID=2652269 RepID=UPI002A761833|nr:TlpA disulfide reductase family protein [Anaerococcus porci]MDY3006376.1 TlpA disulfide reductase family protein [Anaerococcus porci]